MELLGRPPPAYGLKFFVKAGSPDPVMTRHLWAGGRTRSVGRRGRGGAAREERESAEREGGGGERGGADGASHRLSFLARRRAIQRVIHLGRKRFRNCYQVVTESQGLHSQNARQIPRFGVPERSGTCFNGSMAQVDPQRRTIRQIAELAGVSIATVSRVLNGRERRLGRDARPRHPGHPRERLHRQPQRPRPLGWPHRAGRRPRPARLPRLLLGDRRGRRRGALRAATCRSCSPPPATSTSARSP